MSLEGRWFQHRKDITMLGIEAFMVYPGRIYDGHEHTYVACYYAANYAFLSYKWPVNP